MGQELLSADPAAGQLLSSDPSAGLPVYRQSDRTPNDVDPNTIGTTLRTFWNDVNPVQLGQLVPGVPKALGGSGTDHPLALDPDNQYAPNFLVDMHRVKREADALWDKGDKVGAAAKYVESVIPILGPWMSGRGDEAQTGHWAKFGGHALALAANVAMGKAGNDALAARFPLASHPAASAPPVSADAIDFAQQRQIPLDAATVSDNLAVKGAQAIADRTVVGSRVATPANEARAAAMTRVGGELAEETSPLATTPEQAGLGLRRALTDKIAGHAQDANSAYDRLRALEESGTADSVGPTRSQTTVDLRPAKAQLRATFEQLTRQYPLTQQQSSFGYKALSNILQGPDFAPLSQVDQDLGAIKAIAREQGGQAKLGVSALEGAVQKAAAAGGPEVVNALREGRQATIAKYAASDVLDTLHDEPVRTIKALTAPKDAAIQSLRAVTAQVPGQTAEIARAYLEDLLDKPQAVAEWRKLGGQTKAILFPKTSAMLDHFFALTDRISKTNVNPSGSGYVASLAAQGAQFGAAPISAIVTQLGAAGVAKLMRSPAAIQALTRGLSLPSTASTAAKAAAVANVVRSAREAGVVLDFPKAADREAAR